MDAATTEYAVLAQHRAAPVVRGGAGTGGVRARTRRDRRVQSHTTEDTETAYDFYDQDDSTASPISAVLAHARLGRGLTDYGSKTLEIWVQESEWTTKVTDTMTSALAAEFLSDAGTDDDIYDWVAGVFGEEWSAEAGAYSNTVPETDTITILLYPIPYNGTIGPGGIVGFFWGKDNYLRGDPDGRQVSPGIERARDVLHRLGDVRPGG